MVNCDWFIESVYLFLSFIQQLADEQNPATN